MVGACVAQYKICDPFSDTFVDAPRSVQMKGFSFFFRSQTRLCLLMWAAQTPGGNAYWDLLPETAQALLQEVTVQAILERGNDE